jgi:hypothetical protein
MRFFASLRMTMWIFGTGSHFREPVPKIKKNLLKIKTDRINRNT